jgi:hypothetical protein
LMIDTSNESHSILLSFNLKDRKDELPKLLFNIFCSYGKKQDTGSLNPHCHIVNMHYLLVLVVLVLYPTTSFSPFILFSSPNKVVKLQRA